MSHRTPLVTALLAVAGIPLSCGDYAPTDSDTDEVGAAGAPAQPAGGGAGNVPPPSAGGGAMPGGAGTPGAEPPAATPTDTAPEPAAPPAAAASCDMDTTPCGGDVSGTWAVIDCPQTISGVVDMLGFGLGCPMADVSSGSLAVTGTITFNADGTYMDNTVTTGEQEVEMSSACLNVSGTVTQCDRVSSPVQSSLGYEMFTCLPNEGTMGCSCSGVINQEGGIALVALDADTSGMHTTSGTTLSLGTGKEYSYCVANDVMVLTLAAPGKIGTVTGSVVLQKQ